MNRKDEPRGGRAKRRADRAARRANRPVEPPQSEAHRIEDVRLPGDEPTAAEQRAAAARNARRERRPRGDGASCAASYFDRPPLLP